MNFDIPGAIFTLSLSLLILNSHCVEGAKYVRVLQLTPSITFNDIFKFFLTLYLVQNADLWTFETNVRMFSLSNFYNSSFLLVY